VTCQGSSLEVVKRSGFWGQGDVVLEAPEPASLPLGETLELLLDGQHRESRREQHGGSRRDPGQGL
jgi:hypothetical protein